MVTPSNGGDPLSAPILAAALTDTCHSRKTPCAGVKIAAITIQIPFELPTVPDSTGPTGIPQTPDARTITPAQAVIKITEDGASTTELSVNVFESRVHFIQGRHELALDLIDGLSTGASVFHADGNPVAPGLPARMGETLVVYGYGFGRPNRTLRTGEVTAEAIPVPMYGNIQFSVLLPDQPLILDGSTYPASRYISYFGVTPNTVGVYQMNFLVPSIGQGFRRCDASTATNFTVTYTEGAATSSFAFCVEP